MENWVKKYRDTKNKEYLHNYYRRDNYLRIYSKPKQKWLRKFEVMIKLMSLKRGEKVLDVGCASKIFKPYVEECGGIYKGLDISEGFQPDYICDAEDISIIGDDEFDWVVLSDILEHLPNPKRTIAEAYRIAKKVIAVVPNWYRLERFSFLPRHPSDRHIIRKPPKGWVADFEKAGFEITLMQGFFYVPSVAFYPVIPLVAIDYLFRTKPFLIFDNLINKHFADKRLFRFLGQELIILAKRK
jgi:ubiquinone/menaquinone biosynthesis C-methylase UbiE